MQAIGVSLLWSIVNPAHELRVGELIAESLPDIPFTLSHQLNPIVREYRRTSSCVIDASLKPLMQEHLATLDADLRAAGFDGHLFIATSFGGSWRPEEVIERPIYSVGSGPSMAPVAALTYTAAERATDEQSEDFLVCDTGGTTFDVGLVSGGADQLHRRDVAWRTLDRAYHRYPLRRRQEHRRRWRLDRLARSGRSAPRRTAECRGRSRTGLLRPRRHAADGHR